MGSLVWLQAQDEFTPAESKAQNRLDTPAPAPASAKCRLTEGHLPSRQGAGAGAGVVWRKHQGYTDSPRRLEGHSC